MSSDEKPLITVSGNQSLVSDQLSQQITRDLPQEGVEWQRTYGRASKIVYLEAKLVPLIADQHLTAETDHLQLLSRPLLYTYWTDCPDVDTYKAHTRDEISVWLHKLSARGINDWFVVHVDTGGADGRKGINKTKLLPTIKTSVMDKIRNDFPAVKSTGGVERAISLLDATSVGTGGGSSSGNHRNESKTADSYQQFLCRLRALLLSSYSRQLVRYEDYIRTVRESRTQANWNFFHFFGLQEQLAFAFEMLSLYDEALVQYDELDALFSQFVINSTAAPMPDWLSQLAVNYDLWHGLCLSPAVSKALRRQFAASVGIDGDDSTGGTAPATTTAPKTTLVELRNYLFARQSELLLLLNKPWELASRALPFLQNCVNELNILEITMTSGGIACWVFLSALEILHKCERYSDSSQMESYSRHTVGLWSYARNKLAELGALCGLMPGMTMTSEHLHVVVGLIAGMGDDPRTGETPLSPQERLKEALSGQEAFLKHYLEISELTMGTYKHIGRMRFARFIGKELSELYIKMSKPQKAMPFLLDLEKVFLREKWPQLLNEIRVLLLRCYQQTGDSRREFKVRCQLAANPLLTDDQRREHCAAAERLIAGNKAAAQPLVVPMDELFDVRDVRLALAEDNFTVTNRTVELDAKIVSNFPKEILCDRVFVSLTAEPLMGSHLAKHKTSVAAAAKSCPHMDDAPDNLKSAANIVKLIPRPQLETFHTSISVGVKCNNTSKLLLRRSDSHGFILGQDREPEVLDTGHAFTARAVTIKPGENAVRLQYSTRESGTFVATQLVLNWDSGANVVGTTGGDLSRHLCFAVIAEEPTLRVLQLTTLDGRASDILAGVEQSIELQLNCGSSSLPARLPLTIRASHGLQIRLETDVRDPQALYDEIQFPLPVSLKPFQTYEIPLIIKTKLFAQKECTSIQHELTMTWTTPTDTTAAAGTTPTTPTSAVPAPVPTMKLISTQFHLLPPFLATHQLHTCDRRKFIEILVNCTAKRPIVLSEPQLTFADCSAVDTNGLELRPFLPKADSVCHLTQTVHYLWEIVATDSVAVANKVRFGLKYKLHDESGAGNWEHFTADYRFANYHTVYTIRASVEPQNGTEFCRAGSLCHLNVTINRLVAVAPAGGDHSSIMYELVTDQTLWNVCGKTAGVVAVDDQRDIYSVTFDVMPLISGFLPYPTVRLSKYISRDSGGAAAAGGTGGPPSTAPPQPPAPVVANGGQPLAEQSTPNEAKLVAFEAGQVYNWSRATQVHVLPSSGLIVPEV